VREDPNAGATIERALAALILRQLMPSPAYCAPRETPSWPWRVVAIKGEFDIRKAGGCWPRKLLFAFHAHRCWLLEETTVLCSRRDYYIFKSCPLSKLQEAALSV